MENNEKDVVTTEEVKPQTEEVNQNTDEFLPNETKEQLQKKIKAQIKKSKEKQEGKSRILDYLKAEHKWENYVFVLVSLITLVLGWLIVAGTLVVKKDFPVIGNIPQVFAWMLIIISAAGLLYALFPFFKPAFPEFKKITWLKGLEFLGNVIRVFLFIVIFALLFFLYDSFITEIFSRIIR